MDKPYNIYLDNASTSYVYNAAIQVAEQDLFDAWANPSNIYDISKLSKEIIENAKRHLAEIINCDPEEIFFTSGASEGNAWAIKQREICMCSPFEHHSYLANPATKVVTDKEFYDFFKTPYRFVGNKSYAHILVSNETGEVFNVIPLFKKARDNGMFTICDCTQALGNIGIDVRLLGCDMAVFSGHKFHAPKGIGFCYIRKDAQNGIVPLVYGSQQNGLRGGTENIAFIHSMSVAAGLADSMVVVAIERGAKFKDIIRAELNNAGVEYTETVLHQHQSNNIFSFCLKDVESEVIQQLLQDEGIYVGTASACNTGEMGNNKTLEALGIAPEYIRGHIRMSFSIKNSEEQVRIAIKEVIKFYKELTA